MPSPVLCIDDRLPVLALRKANLETQGYSVVVASSGRAAMKILEEMPVDAVLIEYRQEGMDAQAVAHHIKQRHPQQPIVLLSAYSDMPETILWLVDDYVLRSESVERLAQVIKQVSRSSEKFRPHSGAIPGSSSAIA